MEQTMKQIASFTVNHDKLEKGMYISRIDGDVVTYDLRTRRPNAGDYMSNLTMHSVEHILATLLRNSARADDARRAACCLETCEYCHRGRAHILLVSG